LFELLIFDLDGTLVDSRRDIATGVNLMLDDLGVPNREPELIYTYIGGGVHNLVLKSLTQEHADKLEGGVELFWARYKEHALNTTLPYPGVESMLDGFKGRMLAVATNKPYEHTMLILDGLGLKGRFASIQGWRLGLTVKPDPQIVLLALNEAGAHKDKTVMIGDSTSDVLAARAAGIKSCAVGYGYGAREKVMESKPDYFAEKVEDIERLFL